MHPVLSPRRTLTALLATVGVTFGTAASAALWSPAAAASRAARPSASGPPRTVTAGRITAPRGTLRPGSPVPASGLGTRVYVNRRDGFALASLADADYPAATVDGGATWRTDGPALHVNAAQAPLSVVYPGAADAHTFFAFGGGQVVDATGDGGRHWWRAFLGDVVVAVVPRLGGGLIAIAQNAGAGSSASTVMYLSTDGGHHWRLDNRFGT